MKKLFFLFAVIFNAANMMADNYMIDSVYHYYSFKDTACLNKTINQYNSIGQKIQSDSYYIQGGKWKKGRVSTYEYTSNGLLEKSTDIIESKDGISYSQKLYRYKDTLAILIEDRFQRNNEEWKTTGYIESEYNNQNLLIRKSHMNSKLYEWSREQYLYDPAGNNVQMDIYEWSDGEFKVSVRHTFLYNENNLLIQEKTYVADKLSDQVTYEYDANNFLIQRIYYIEFQGILHPSSKIEFLNNKEGRAIKSFSYSNLDFKGKFILQTKTENTYDSNGNLTSTTHMGYINGTWYPLSNSDERWIYYYK